MIRSCRFLTLSAVLIGAVSLGAPSVAQADFQLRYSLDGGTTFTTIMDNVGVPNVSGDQNLALNAIDTLNFAGMSIHGSSTTNGNTGLTTMDLQVNGNATPGTYNILVQATLTNINTAPPPQAFNFAFTGTLQPPTAGLAFAMQTWVNQNNALFGTTGDLANTGSHAPNFNGSSSMSGTVPYSMTEQITITGTTATTPAITTDNNASIVAGPNVSTTPAPAGVVLAMAGLPVLGLGLWLRRRLSPLAV